MNNSLCHQHDIPLYPSKTNSPYPKSTRTPNMGTVWRRMIQSLCQLTAVGCNDIDDRKSSQRTCITAGNVFGETCPLATHQFFTNLLSLCFSGHYNWPPVPDLSGFSLTVSLLQVPCFICFIPNILWTHTCRSLIESITPHTGTLQILYVEDVELW